MEGKLRISYVANLLGITPHYLRMFEWEGRFPKVNYDRVGRFYTGSDVKLLRAMGVGTHPQKLRRVEDVLEGPQLVTHHASCSALQASRQTWPATPAPARGRTCSNASTAAMENRAVPQPPPNNRKGQEMIRPQPSMLHKPDVFALVWELHSRLPETRSREPYELLSLLWSLGYCEDLIPECEIAAAIEAARLDWCRMRPVFNLGGAITVVGWDRFALCELVED
jgi:hypothetical protein